MTIHMHADDYGLSKGITDAILDTVDNGVLSGVSVMANGHALRYALAEYQKRPALRLSIHLNLTEGRAICRAKDVPLLVDDRGYFRHSFTKLWLWYLLASPKKQKQFQSEITKEFLAQIEVIASALDDHRHVRVDSHQYVHLIPFAFRSLLAAHKERRLSYVRVAAEPFFLSANASGAVRSYCGANLLKHVLLNVLSRRAKRELRLRGIAYNEHLIGVLFTGRMSEAVVGRALRRLRGVSKEVGDVELLFHPGGALEQERLLWEKAKPTDERFYFAPERLREREALKSVHLRELIETP